MLGVDDASSLDAFVRSLENSDCNGRGVTCGDSSSDAIAVASAGSSEVLCCLLLEDTSAGSSEYLCAAPAVEYSVGSSEGPSAA